MTLQQLTKEATKIRQELKQIRQLLTKMMPKPYKGPKIDIDELIN